MLLLTLRGTPTLYYGDEIGMRNVAIPPGSVRDPWERNVPGLGLGRDPERTPMQWDDRLNAGFTLGTPWLPVAADYAVSNVAAERRDPTSLLMLYRRLMALRRETPALSVGTYEPVLASGDVLAYVRAYAGQRLLVVLNLGSQPQQLELCQAQLQGCVALSTHLDRAGERVGGAISLRADEGAIVLVD